MNRIVGLLTAGLVVLLTVWAYNKFSGKNISSLGAGAAAA